MKKICIFTILSLSSVFATNVEMGEVQKKECKELNIEVSRMSPITKKCENIKIETRCDLKELIYGLRVESNWKECPEDIPNDIPIHPEETKLKIEYEQTLPIQEERNQIIDEIKYPTAEDDKKMAEELDRKRLEREQQEQKMIEDQTKNLEEKYINPIQEGGNK